MKIKNSNVNKDVSLNEALFPQEDILGSEMLQSGEFYFDDEPFQINDTPINDGTVLDDILPQGTPQRQRSAIMWVLNDLIHSSEATVERYNSILEMIESDPDTGLDKIRGLSEIIKEMVYAENKNIGKLRALVDGANPDSKAIEAGKSEIIQQFSNMQQENNDILHPTFNVAEPTVVNQLRQLPVKTFPQHDSNMNSGATAEDTCSGDDLCTVSGADDDF